MHHVLVFSTSASPHDRPSLATRQLRDISGGIANQGNITWLAKDVAAECLCDDLDKATLHAIRQRADTAQIDVNMVPIADRKKALLIADMDSTIIEGESLDDMADLAGLGAAIAAITARAMRGELDFEQALDERVGMLAGHPATLFDQALAHTKLMPGAAIMVQTMRANGAFCYLISGGFTTMAGPVADRCGFNGFHANEMTLEDGLITGAVKKPVLGRDAKAAFLSHYTTQHALSPTQSLCVGDGANDMTMLQAASMGVAFQGKPLLRAAIETQLNHTDLTGLLFLQGYSVTDFVSTI